MIAKTTLRVVARRVGVPTSTISRVLNAVNGVNEATRRKVLGAGHDERSGECRVSRHPAPGDKAEDEMIVRGDSAGALLMTCPPWERGF
jgi:hypothetical protein